MKNQTILMLGYSDWDHWRPTHELAQIFSRDNLVIFVERLLGYNDLRWKGVRRKDCLKRFCFKPMCRISENLFVIQPPPHPLPTSISILSRFMGKQIMYFSNYLGKIFQAKWLKFYLRRLDIMPTVLFLNHPSDLHLAGHFGERVSCWRVYDELALGSAGTNYSGVLNKVERKNTKRIDLVFASSQKQFKNRKKTHSSISFIPNGCDFGSIRFAIDNNSNEPHDIKVIPRPRIGYVGTIDSRIDFSLLEHLAENCPDLSLVIIGWINWTVKDIMSKLTSYPNLFFLGTKTKREIPHYIEGFDVGLIPFKKNKMTDSMLPLKTFEYLACGLPVVTTALHELLPYSECLAVADNELEFSDLVARAIHDKSKERASKRISIARENSWEVRARQMGELISGQLSQKSQV